jgi:AraC-like DNA-binding protein
MIRTDRPRSWLRMLPQKRFFTRLIITTALIALIPGLLSNVVSYYNVSHTFEEETGRNKLQFVSQTMNAVEIILNRIRENTNLLVLNQAFLAYERFPNGGYYESLQGELPKSDLPKLYDYLEAKKNAMLTIHSFRISNEYVHSVYFHDRKKNLVLTSDNDGYLRQFAPDAFYDAGWQASYREQGSRGRLVSRTAELYESGREHVLTIFHETKDRNVLIINLSAEKLYRDMVDRLNGSDDTYIVSSDGRIVLHADTRRLHRPLWSFLPDDARDAVGRHGYFVVRDGGGARLVSHSASPLLGWTLINVSDLQAVSESTASLRRTIVLSAGVVLLLSVSLAYASSKSLYRPVTRLEALAGDRHAGTSGARDEFGRIGRFVQMTVRERDYYKEKLEESFPVHREQFKCSLLRRHAMSLDEIAQKTAYFGIDIELRGLAVLALMWDDENGDAGYGRTRCDDSVVDASGTLESPECADNDGAAFETGGSDFGDSAGRIGDEAIRRRIVDALAAALSGTKHFIAAPDDGMAAVVVNCGDIDREQLHRLGRRLLDAARRAADLPGTLGIGGWCETALDLPQAYDEALTALRYRILYGSGQVIDIDDIRVPGGERAFRYPAQQEQTLLTHLKALRKAEALAAFRDWLAEIDAHKKKLHYNDIHPIFMQLLTGILHELHRAGMNMNLLVGDADPYRQLLEHDSIDGMADWMRRLISQAVDRMASELNARGNQHIAKAIRIMERDYHRDISLHSVAEELSMNPAYLSRLFKRITGQSFVDYLKRIRIEKSKELLLNSELKINEVGKRVGYEHSYYFIKVFKETIGLTPGEYKKLYGS